MQRFEARFGGDILQSWSSDSERSASQSESRSRAHWLETNSFPASESPLKFGVSSELCKERTSFIIIMIANSNC